MTCSVASPNRMRAGATVFPVACAVWCFEWTPSCTKDFSLSIRSYSYTLFDICGRQFFFFFFFSFWPKHKEIEGLGKKSGNEAFEVVDDNDNE